MMVIFMNTISKTKFTEKTLNADGTTTDKYSYEYDKLGQLVRFNDAVANKTYTYTYGNNGNILTKSEYAYTLSDELGAATNITNFGYEAEWKDRLSTVGDKTIRYDNIGNPTDYLGATLTWQGRELKSYENEEFLINYEYDENGMRYRTTAVDKTSEENTTVIFDYVWLGEKLVSMVVTGDDSTSLAAKYLYNSSGEVIGFKWVNGTDAQATYYYLKNLQGDITGIVNSAGKLEISFSYDVWGKRTAQYHANASLPTGAIELIIQMYISLLNPFGYRGYCYDGYAGFYYLQSRYYDSNTGRFINADDTNYLNATGTVLGCNLFAYCENDAVNFVDENGYYSRNQAIEYAKTWWDDFNPMYQRNEKDCANFVSQCLYAGKMAKMTGFGDYGWHHYVMFETTIYNKWGIAVGTYPIVWQISDAWGKSSKLYKYLTKTKEFKKRKIETVKELNSVISKGTYSKGDVAFFAKGSKISHTVIIGKIVNKKNKKNIYYFAHTDPRNGYDTSSKKSKGFKEVIQEGKNIYIVKIK